MPLTAFQAELAALLARNRTFDSSLAGGAAILIEPNTSRYSNDLDYFHDSEERVAEAFAADREALADAGYSLTVGLNQPGYIRAVVASNGEETKVEWSHDSSWRFMPTMRDPRCGYLLHPIDFAVKKVLALAGRDEPRDVVDVLDQHRDVLALGALCWAACGKDPGFTPLSVLSLLRRRGRLRKEELGRLQLAVELDLEELKRDWLAALDSVEPFIAARPAAEIGCLYYSASRQAFVDPRRVADAVPHFGRPGGVVPRVVADPD